MQLEENSNLVKLLLQIYFGREYHHTLSHQMTTHTHVCVCVCVYDVTTHLYSFYSNINIIYS